MKFPQISLAPIHEYTNSTFRLLCQKHNAKYTFVPLVNVTSVVKGKIALDINESEKNVTVQLSGSKPSEFSDAIKVIEDKYKNIIGFNINAGCPSYTTMKTGAGSALMRNEKTLSEIIKQCKKSTSLPISVKSRIFSDEKKTIEFYKEIEAAGADYLIVHGRTVKQGYSGKADWNIIKKIKDEINIPLIGNGDIKKLEDGKEKIRLGYCDGVMIGRAALENPLLFEGINEISKKEKKNLILEYYEICRNIGYNNLNNFKIISVQIIKGIRNASSIRDKIMKCKKIEEIIEIIDNTEK